MAAFIAKLRGFVDQFPESTAIAVVNNELSAATGAINQTFGTTLSAPQFQAPSVTPLSTSAPLTPEDVVALGTGVDLTALSPALVEAAALLDPESVAGQFINAQGEPIGVVPSIDSLDVAQVRQESEIPVTDSSPAVRELQLIRKTDMVHDNLFDPIGIGGSFFPDDPPIIGAPPTVTPTGPPTSPGFGGFDLGDALKELLEGIVKGQGIGDIIGDVFTGGFGIGDTGDQLPIPAAIAPGQPTLGGNGDLLDILKKLLLELSPAGEIFAGGQAAQDIFDLFKSKVGLPSPVSPGVGIGNGLSVGLNGQLGPGVACDVKTVMNTQIKQVHTAPKGFVVVVCTGSNGLPVKMAMWKPLAIKLGLWKAARKPPMSASEWRTLKVADRVKTKVKRIAGTAGFKVEVKGKARRRAAVCK